MEAPETERSAIAQEISRYYERRNAFTVGDDPTDFYVHYPDLERNQSPAQGVNADSSFRARMQAGRVTAVLVDLERREPVRVIVAGERAVAFVNGRETWKYATGADTVGQMQTVFELRRTGDRWTILRTDTSDVGDPPRTPPPRR